ncbi:hypothetical protein [Tahibacter caeni]|uniref:hypothetical protein n=1 Tax=Tahibacter caeni TaxID=1453545 RepID=UPI002148CF68|nr:hypothetical protein [Tahibacter caeni]
MSYSSHKKQALDADLPIRHRLSHVRSCAVCVAEKYGVGRSVILDRIGIADAHEEHDLPSAQHIEAAIAALDEIKASGIPANPRLDEFP